MQQEQRHQHHQQQPSKNQKMNDDKVKCTHDLYYSEINFLRVTQNILRDILDMEPQIQIHV